MKRKIKPSNKCQKVIYTKSFMYPTRSCGNPVKALVVFNEPGYVPLRVCGVHASMYKKRGYRVEPLP